MNFTTGARLPEPWSFEMPWRGPNGRRRARLRTGTIPARLTDMPQLESFLCSSAAIEHGFYAFFMCAMGAAIIAAT